MDYKTPTFDHTELPLDHVSDCEDLKLQRN